MAYTAHVLGAAGYGVVAFAGAVMLYATHFVEAGIETTGIAAVARDPAHAGPLAGSLLAVRLGIALVLTTVLVAAGLTVFPQPEGAVLAAFACALPIRALTSRWALIGLGRTGAASVARIAGEAATALAVLLAVRSLGDVQDIAATQVVGDAAAALVMMVALGPAIRGAVAGWRGGVAAPVLRDSWPLLANALLALVVFNGDLLLLRVFRDSSAVGWYAAAYALVSFLVNVGATFGFSLLPGFTRHDADPDARRRLFGLSVAAALTATVPFAAGGMVEGGRLIGLVYGDGFEPAVPVLKILLWSVPLGWLRFVAQFGLVSQGRQNEVLRITIIGAVTAIVLDLVLIPPLGLVGAAIATTATEGLRTLLTFRAAGRLGLGLGGPTLRRLWRPALAVLLMLAVVTQVRGLPSLAVIALGAAVYGVVLLATGVVVWRPGHRPYASF